LNQGETSKVSSSNKCSSGSSSGSSNFPILSLIALEAKRRKKRLLRFKFKGTFSCLETYVYKLFINISVNISSIVTVDEKNLKKKTK